MFPSKGLEQNFPISTSQQTTQDTSAAKPKAASTAHNSTSSRKTSTTGVKGLLQIVELEVFSPTKAINVFGLCDSGCSHTWISDDLAQKLSLGGKVTSITVNEINCQEVVQTRTVEVNFCSILPDEGREVFTVNAFTKSSIISGRDFIDVAALKSKYPHLDPVPGTQIDNSSLSMILGQDAYEAIRPIECFVSSTDKSSPVAVGLPIGWVLSGPLPSTSNLLASCFEASSEEDSTLAREVKLWYDIEAFGAVKNVDPSSAEESHAKKILHLTTFYDGKKYVVGMLWLSAVPYETKHPVVLDGLHPLARLYLKHVHDSNHHQGVDFLRAHVQKTFAVLKLRSTLRSISSCYVTCRKHRATPVTPLIDDLPKERLGYQERPLTYTGVDYFGPFHVSVIRSTEKRWGFLFTCMTTRPVHIEIVPKRDTSSCVMGIERFVARREHPHTIWSDNGTNFVGADKKLALCFANLDPDKVAQTSASKGIKWKFNPPSAPHHGGVWERLVQSCKRLFYKILGNRRLTDEVLRTTFCLVEQFLNSRPLTAASSDPKDLDALTPNHFLFGGPSAASLFHVPQIARPDNQWQRYRKSIAYAKAIWHRWLTEYAPTLNVRSKWNRQDPTTLKTGDLVWIVEPTRPRGFYLLARVKELHYGCHGIARSAVIRSSAGVFTRPATKLVSVFDSSSLRREDVAYAN